MTPLQISRRVSSTEDMELFKIQLLDALIAADEGEVTRILKISPTHDAKFLEYTHYSEKNHTLTISSLLLLAVASASLKLVRLTTEHLENVDINRGYIYESQA